MTWCTVTPHPIGGKPYELHNCAYPNNSAKYRVLTDNEGRVAVSVGRRIERAPDYAFTAGEFEAVLAWQAEHYSEAERKAALELLK